MNKKELICELASRTKTSRATSRKSLNALISIITETLNDDKDIMISKFGKFTIRQYKEYTNVSPITGGTIQVPKRKICIFKGSKEFLDNINQ